MSTTDIKKTININGENIYFEIYGVGKPVLILHGFTGSGAGLADLFKDLIPDYQLIIPDLRGHGRSTNSTHVFTHSQATADIFSLLEYLNIDKFSAVGFSAGGNILLKMAAQQPDRVHAMTVLSATPYFPDQGREFMRKYAEDEKTADDWTAMRKIHLLGDDQIKMLWQQAKAFCDSRDDLTLTNSDLSKIKAKTLIIQGDRDPFYPVEISVEMYRQIPNASLWIIPNGGHVSLTETWLKPFLDMVKTHIEGK